jgi:hypothetical protein
MYLAGSCGPAGTAARAATWSVSNYERIPRKMSQCVYSPLPWYSPYFTLLYLPADSSKEGSASCSLFVRESRRSWTSHARKSPPLTPLVDGRLTSTFAASQFQLSKHGLPSDSVMMLATGAVTAAAATLEALPMQACAVRMPPIANGLPRP